MPVGHEIAAVCIANIAAEHDGIMFLRNAIEDLQRLRSSQHIFLCLWMSEVYAKARKQLLRIYGIHTKNLSARVVLAAFSIAKL